MEFLPEIDITAAEAEAIARGLYAVARAEGGVHEQEAALIRGFYGDATGGDGRTLAALERQSNIEPEHLAHELRSPAVRELFLKTALLIGWADNSFSPEEDALIRKYGVALGYGPELIAEFEQGVKEYLLSHLVYLKDVESTRKVAQKLGV